MFKIFLNFYLIFFTLNFLFARDNNSKNLFNTDIYDYNWPIKAKPYITSSFAEYRPTHFHAGIDISTEHVIGVEVYAARDGYIKNISVSPSGYGKFLVIKHHDNFFTTYAHLHSFKTEIEKLILEAQTREKNYAVELSFTPEQFKVKKGELVAYSGESGAGPPHLHFEIRDNLFNPINPLLFPNLRNYNDIFPPVFKKIAFTPLNEKSFVNHEFTSQIFTPKLKNSRSYSISDTLFFTGSIGLATDVFDRTSERGDRITIYGLELFIDDKPYFISERNAFLTAQYGQVSLYYDWNLLQSQEGRFHKLYLEGTNTLSFYPLSVFADKMNEYSGKISLDNLTEGRHKFTIRAIDYDGLISECSGNFILNHPTLIEVKEISKQNILMNVLNLKDVNSLEIAGKTFNSNNWEVISYGVTTFNPNQTDIQIPINLKTPDIVRITATNKYGTISFPQYFILNPKFSFEQTKIEKKIKSNKIFITLKNKIGFTKAPSLVAYDKQHSYPVTLIPRSVYEYEGVFKIPEHSEKKIFLKGFLSIGYFTTEITDSVEFLLLKPETGTIFTSGDNNFISSFDKDAVYEHVPIFIKKEKSGNYSISAKNVFLRSGLNIQLRCSEDKILDYKNAVYVLAGTVPIYLSNERNLKNNSFIVRKTSRLGEYVILADEKAPEIYNWKTNRWFNRTNYLFSFKIKDNLSGVDVDKIDVYLDGEKIFPVYDIEKKSVSHYNFTDNKIKSGKHIIDINLEDKVGNSSSFSKMIWTN
ncbi:MAG: M23 family metallopeptidase [Bacteroidetes bacterium]|nr:M23 family metallopeptidase [Bacteroidota bacterium]